MAGQPSSHTRRIFNPTRTQVGNLRYSRQGCLRYLADRKNRTLLSVAERSSLCEQLANDDREAGEEGFGQHFVSGQDPF